MKRILTIAIIALLLLSGAYIIYTNSQTSEIEDTANIVENIREIGQFTSMHVFTEVVVVENKKSNFSNSFIGKIVNLDYKDEIVIIAKSHANIGYDLQKISMESINVSGDTISITLPPIEIFDVIINPSEVEVFQEDGKWSHEQISALSAKAKDKVLKEIKEKGILDKATEQGISKLKEMLKLLGFSVVNISTISES